MQFGFMAGRGTANANAIFIPKQLELKYLPEQDKCISQCVLETCAELMKLNRKTKVMCSRPDHPKTKIKSIKIYCTGSCRSKLGFVCRL